MDNEYSSFYLYRKYEVIGDELVDLGITSIDANGTLDPVVKEECDQTCGCLNYTELCAIEKKSGYIGNVDLGLRLTNNFKIQISFNYKTAAGGMLIGEGGNTRFFKSSNGNTYLDLNGQRISWNNSSFCPMNTDVTFEIGNRYMKNLGNDMEMTGSAITFTSESNLLLFSMGGDMAVVYWVKVYDGNTLVGDFIPVRNDYNGVITMLNKITGTLCNVNGSLYEMEECVEPIYRWVQTEDTICVASEYRWTESGTTCDNANKYQNNIKEESIDGGITWSVVIPEEYSASTLIQQDSYDCGYRTGTTSSSTYCNGDDLYVDVYYKISRDSGTTWTTASTTPTLVKAGGCPTPASPKFTLTLNDSSTVSAECDSTSAITREETGEYYGIIVSVEIGNCVNTINDRVFKDCKSLTSVTIPNSVTSIGYGAFLNCSGLTSIDIPSGVTSIGERAFLGCSGLTSIDIPSGVTSIGEYTFLYCSGLTSVTIPDSVTSIGNSAFTYCRSLTSVTILATTPPSLGINPFQYTNSCPIYVPAASLANYQYRWTSYSGRIRAIP